MVGLDARSTMDLDATIKGANVNVEGVENMMAEIISVPIDDGVTFQVKSISEIMDEAEYPGIRVTMITLFDGVRTPLKIDISTGDAITPKEVRYSFSFIVALLGVVGFPEVYFFSGFCGQTIAIAFPALIVIIIAVSTIFSSEYSTKMDALILTTR